MKKNILFISNNNLTANGLSGGDRIFLEFLKNWKTTANIGVLGSEECFEMIKRYKIKGLALYKSSDIRKNIKNPCSNYNYFIHTIFHTFKGISAVFKYRQEIKKYKYIYSASDFFPDSLPGFLIKIFFKNKIWLGSLYLFAPSPFQKNNPYKLSLNRFLTGTLYWLTQKIPYYLIYLFADYVFVTSKPDVKKFLNSNRKSNKIIIVQGGVDITSSEKYLKAHHKNTSKKYTAVFIGRLHYQKGVLELIHIWNLVCKLLPHAKLAIIGNGQLLPDIKLLIKKYKLQKNTELLGFLEGEKKYKIFKQSLMVLHPSIFDSGGMASAEAMAWGLPAISFDLEALKTYYPKGMYKIKYLDLNKFAKTILEFTKNKKLYKQYSQDALSLIRERWSWPERANQIYKQLF